MYRMLPEERALLDTIASTESPGYNVMYGGSTFDTFGDHPRQYHTIMSGPNKGQKSSAAGRYQFLASTWDRLAKSHGLKDFSPMNQDIGALMLAREDYARATGRNLQDDLMSKDPAVLGGIGTALSKTWTSLPSGIESAGGMDKFVRTFGKRLDNPDLSNASISERLYAGSSMAGASAEEVLGLWRDDPSLDPLAGIPPEALSDLRESMVSAAPAAPGSPFPLPGPGGAGTLCGPQGQ